MRRPYIIAYTYKITKKLTAESEREMLMSVFYLPNICTTGNLNISSPTQKVHSVTIQKALLSEVASILYKEQYCLHAGNKVLRCCVVWKVIQRRGYCSQGAELPRWGNHKEKQAIVE